MYHYVQAASSGLRMPPRNPTHRHPNPRELRRGIDTPLGSRARSPFIGLSSPERQDVLDSAPRLHPGFISEVHDGRRPVITNFPSHDAPRGARSERRGSACPR